MAVRKAIGFLAIGIFGLAVSAFAQERARVMEWSVGGEKREAMVIAPAKSSEHPPVIFVFHGHGGSMRAQARVGFQDQWPEAVVVCPQGLPTASPRDPQGDRSGWQSRQGVNGDRDLKFFDAMLQRLRREFRIDDRRIYATGHSNGGGFTYLLWSARGSEFAALAPSAAGAAALREAKILPKLPILHVAGEADEIVPFANQQKTMDQVRQHLGCAAQGQPWDSAGDLKGLLYKAPEGAPFVSLIHPGTHKYPAAAPALIVKFFQQHAKQDPAKSEAAKIPVSVDFSHYSAAPGYSEGPTWRNGEVFFCSGGLLRVDAQKKVSTYLSLGPAGTVLRADGTLLVCDNKHKALLEVTPAGQVNVLADAWETRPLRSLNDLTIDARGNVYWTDPEGSTPANPVGAVYRLRPDGRVDRLASGLAFPNGIEVDPASQFLYVIESQSKKILRYPLPADNELLGPPELFYELGGSGGDGCSFDESGNLWVADFHRPDTGKGQITVLSPEAKVLGHYPLPSKVVSNITFGGANRDEIYCTTGDPPGVFHAIAGVRGFAGHPGKSIPVLRSIDLVPQTPHVDADSLRAMAKLAANADLQKGMFDDALRKELELAIAALHDPQVRADMQKLLPAMEIAAARHALDQPLFAEIKRLRGTYQLEYSAPRWLRAIAGDDSLAVFGRLAELNWNERTDGHKEPEKRLLANRVHDETLKLLVGQDRLRKLELSGTAVTSAGLVHLQDLTALERLNVCLTAVDDSGFVHLSRLTKMQRMTICASKITGSGFAHLSGMNRLESINLHSAPASDEGLAAIGKLTSLRRLEIVHTQVTDVGLAHVANLTRLRQLHVHGPLATASALPFLSRLPELYELDLYEGPASNASLGEIGKLSQLRFLRLFNGNFDDEGVKQLARLESLEELTLQSPKLTDAGLEHLAGLKNLRVLALSGKFTPEGVVRLRERLPKTQITP
jgi:polyhydroxybutyrate depolymerase